MTDRLREIGPTLGDLRAELTRLRSELSADAHMYVAQTVPPDQDMLWHLSGVGYGAGEDGSVQLVSGKHAGNRITLGEVTTLIEEFVVGKGGKPDSARVVFHKHRRAGDDGPPLSTRVSSETWHPEPFVIVQFAPHTTPGGNA